MKTASTKAEAERNMAEMTEASRFAMPKAIRASLATVAATAFLSVGIIANAQERQEWVLAVYVSGDLEFVGTYASEAQCHAAGRDMVRQRGQRATYICSLKRIYRPG